MKTITKFQKIAFIVVIAILAVSLNSCHKNDNNDSTKIEEGTISGKWRFTVSPNVSYQDTTTINGVSAADYEEGSSSYNEVYLYEDKNHEIYGETWGYKINGKRTGNIVHLNFYEFPNGPFDESVKLEKMKSFTQMDLTVNKFGIMEGGGSYVEDPDQEWTKIDTYFIKASKLSDISNPNLKSSLKNILCDIGSKISSYLISGLTDGVFRPMSSCYGYKDGGGFYAFGHEGPGGLLPIYTQTVYMAWEWSWCKVRKYSFNIDLKDEVIGYKVVKDAIRTLEPRFHLLGKLGFNDMNVFTNLLDNFYEKYGGFAISAAFDTHTQNMSLYVNYEKGSSNDVKHDIMIETIRDGLDSYCHDITVYAGKDIHDYFHMRRSDFDACNSKIIFFYLFGTNHVNYN